MLEDRVLLEKFKSGSRDAFRLIYGKYADDLLNLAANLLNDTAGAEDVVQDVFISFVQSVEQFHLKGSLKGYLATCVANRARDYLRKSKHQRNETEYAEPESKSPVQLVIRDEELQKLSYALTELPYEQREVIALHLYGDLRFRQIAKMRNVSIKTIQSQYRYGLDKLRSMMNNGEVKK